MNYKVYTTAKFEKEFDKLSPLDKEIVRKLYQQLKENPFVGDAIKYSFFREKRLREKRVYYLVYEDITLVLMVALGGKKTQQATIEEILSLLREYKNYVKTLADK